MPSRRLPSVRSLAGAALFVAWLAVGGSGCSDTRSAANSVAVGGDMAGSTQMAAEFTSLSRAEQVELLERDLRRHFGPDVRVGQIRRIATATRGALVVDLDTSGLREGDSLLFVDQQGRAVAAGTLLVVKPHELLVEYDETLVENGRPVTLDDLAVLNLGS